MKTCPWCNGDFTPRRDWQEFCCTKHQQAWHRHERKLVEVRVAEAARARANGAQENVERHVARLDDAMQTHKVPAQEPFRRRL